MEQKIICSVDGAAAIDEALARQHGEGGRDDEDGRSGDESDWGQGLPCEVLEAVFLGLQECFIGGPACARLACKRWAGAFAAAWPQLTPPGDFPPLPGWAQRSFRGLTELDLSCCGPDTLRRFLHETPLLPRLESLRLPTCCGDGDLDGTLRGLRTLSSLSLRHCKELTDEGLYRALQGGGGGGPPPLSRLDLFGCSRVTEAALEALEGLPLTELDLGRCDLSSLATLSSVPSLKRLGIGYCRALSDSDLAALPAALPLLCSLDLYECIGLTDTCVERHVAELRGLEELHLAFGDALTDRGVAALGPLTELQTLNLYATAVTPQGIRSLPFLERLLTLNLGGTEAATDQGIAAIASAAPSLTSLTVARGLVTDTGLESLQTLTGLRTLSLRDNPSVSDQSLPRLLPLPLTSLDLSFCHQVTGAGLQESLCEMRRLEELSLEGCYLVCPEGLMALTVLSSLRSLNLVGCDQVTDSVAGELQECFEQEEALTIFL